jgi:hypothetical protein
MKVCFLLLPSLLVTGLAVSQAAPQQTVRRTGNPHGPLKIACESCHTTSGWRPIRPHPEFDHNTQTSYPLRGGHAGAACISCHLDPVFRNVSHECAACHADVHRRQFGPNCAQCHTVRGFKTAVRETREHFTRFPLLGAHASAPCESCHKSAAAGIFAGLSTECAACHMQQYREASWPPHAASRFPVQCASCHSLDSWQGAKFDHAAITGFALTGAHERLECRACHAAGQFAGTLSACVSCHARDFASTRNPDHAAAGFPRDCSLCHNTTRWQGATFDHTARTRFPLTGAHVQAKCIGCHTAGRYAGTPQNCDSCHLEAYRSTSNPNHPASNFPLDCNRCHSTSQWKGASFDHSLSRFALTGAHARVECASCHKEGKYTGTPMACEGCHLAQYNQTANPNHAAAGFPKDCALCHTTAGWKGAKFDHTAMTRFPLTGAHVQVQCASCHKNGVYKGTPATCEGCHLAQYNQTANPNHAAAGFPKDCSICHNTTRWSGAVFDHSKTRFPLTGAHRNVNCANCHVGGRYTGTPTDCYTCHRKAYETVTNPNHLAAGFPKDCAQCHTTSQWKGATFNHKFPIYTGKHAGKWTTCNDCHTNPSNYAAFSCIDCHAHNKTDMDKKHKNRPNYVYASPACYQCHPQGKG